MLTTCSDGSVMPRGDQKGGSVAVKAVIFDIGGVLACDVWEHLFLDHEGGIVARYQLDEGNVRKIGETLWEKFAHLPIAHGETWESREREYWTSFIAQSNIKATADDLVKLTDTFIRPIAGMRELVERLRSSGIALALCSNNTEFWFRRQMDKLGLQEFFDSDKVILSCRLGVSKSSKGHEMFQAAVDTLKVNKEDCVFVDDREENVLQALESGLCAIRFRSQSARGVEYLERVLNKMVSFVPTEKRNASHSGEVNMDAEKKIETVLAEYKSLRDEVIASMNNRHTILNYGLLGLAALFAACVAGTGLTGDAILRVAILMFGIPCIAGCILELWYGEYRRMQRAGAFLCTVEARINSMANDELLTWEMSLRGIQKGEAKAREGALTSGHMVSPYVAVPILVFVFSCASVVTAIFISRLSNVLGYWQFVAGVSVLTGQLLFCRRTWGQIEVWRKYTCSPRPAIG